MPTPPYRPAIAAAVLALTGGASAADLRLGDLPGGSLSTSETQDVAAEICRDHLFDPATSTPRLPAGYRLVLASEAAARNRSLETLLEAQPKLRTHALGSLCFLSAGRLAVDDTPVRTVGPMPMAFWWAAVEGPRHPDMRGKATWVQLGSWYPASVQDRGAILKTDPMAAFVDVQIDAVEPNRWRMRLVLPGETVTADVTAAGSRVPSRAAQPGYMSVPMSGPAADRFWVFTYYGHHHRSAQGTWQATGSGTFSSAFSIAGEAGVFGTVFQDGWTSRSGLYRFSARQ